MDPLTIVGLVGGVANAAGSIFGAAGEQQNQNAQIDYANRSRLRAYNDQLKMRAYNWSNTVNAYNARKGDYQRAVLNINEGLNETFLNTQLQLNEQFKAAAFKGQESMINQIQSQGKLAAGLQAGRSSARAMALDRAAYGRNAAILSESLASKQMASKRQNRRAELQAQSALNQAYSRVGPAPTQPPPISPPEMMGYNPGNNINMIGSVLGAVGGLATTVAGLDFGGGASPTPNADSLKIPSYSNFAGSGVFGMGGFGPS